MDLAVPRRFCRLQGDFLAADGYAPDLGDIHGHVEFQSQTQLSVAPIGAGGAVVYY